MLMKKYWVVLKAAVSERGTFRGRGFFCGYGGDGFAHAGLVAAGGMASCTLDWWRGGGGGWLRARRIVSAGLCRCSGFGMLEALSILFFCSGMRTDRELHLPSMAGNSLFQASMPENPGFVQNAKSFWHSCAVTPAQACGHNPAGFDRHLR